MITSQIDHRSQIQCSQDSDQCQIDLRLKLNHLSLQDCYRPNGSHLKARRKRESDPKSQALSLGTKFSPKTAVSRCSE